MVIREGDVEDPQRGSFEQLRMILHRMQTASLCPDDRPIAFAV
jgi:hypothetical protein